MPSATRRWQTSIASPEQPTDVVLPICAENEKATELAEAFAIPKVFHSIEEAIATSPANVIYDIAVPASTLINVLEKLPTGATVLMQKPMGENIKEAYAILTL